MSIAFHRRKWALVLVAAIFGYAAAFAQSTVFQQTLTGSEAWVVAQGAGGPSAWVNINTVRNGTNITTTSGSGSATSTGVGGMLVWTGTAPTTWTVTLPTTPANGTIQCVTTDTTLTTMVSVVAGGSNTIAAAFSNQTLTANTTVACWQFNTPNTKWYRIQ